MASDADSWREALEERDRLAAENAALMAWLDGYEISTTTLEPATRRVLAAVELAEAFTDYDAPGRGLEDDPAVHEADADRLNAACDAYRTLREEVDGE